MVTANIGSGTISVLDRLGAHSATSVRVAAAPEGIAISPDGRKARAGSDRDSANTRRAITMLHIAAHSIVSTAEVPGSPSPDGPDDLARQPVAFVALQGRNRVVTIDLDAARIVNSAPTGTGSDGVDFSTVTSDADE